MKMHNILLALYTCLIPTFSYSMLTLMRLPQLYRPAQMLPTLQKRTLASESLDTLVTTTALEPSVAMPVAVCAGAYVGYRIASRIYVQSEPERYTRNAYKYFRECCAQKHTDVINEQLLRSFDRDSNRRSQFLLDLKNRYEQLQCVTNLEIAKYLQLDQEQSLTFYRDTILGIIETQQNRIFDAACTVQEDMSAHEEQLIQHYTNILGQARVSYLVKQSIEQELKKQRTIIEEIKQLHQKPMQKEIRNKE